MKRILSILLLTLGILTSNVSKSQGSITFESGTYNKWYMAESGSGSFHALLSTDYKVRNDGFYYFNIYFFSNAANSSGYLTSAYIENISVSIQYYDKNTATYRWKQVVFLPYVLVQPKTQYNDGMYNAAYVYSSDPYQRIRVSWSKSSAY